MESSAVANSALPGFPKYFNLGVKEIFGVEEEHLPWNLTAEQDAQATAVGKGMSIRVGRIAFLYWLREHQQQLGWEDLTFKLFPARKKLLSGLKAINTWVTTELRVSFEITDLSDRWQLSCDLPVSSLPSSIPYQWEFLLGFFQEFTRWAGQGRLFNVQLSQSENAIVFTISKLPID